ncbi:MAG TPA: hypothetical protein VHL12_03680 [Gemmatimonadaceae bacterium]|jgi:hypothetical protein|nr:hypothetical protein [Gemmatimonadaceae bacterium]
MLLKSSVVLLVLTWLPFAANAQQGYEFEVYGAEAPARGHGELEFHLNFVPSGAQLVDDDDGRATHRALRSSLELGAGITSWLSANLYAVTYAKNGSGIRYVGNRARVTAIAPQSWGLPFAVGMAHEVGYARPGFAENQWAYEFTPIFGKEVGKLTILVNPAFERGLAATGSEWEFEPRARLGYSFDDDESVGLEYYSVLGPLSGFDERSHQQHQLFGTAATELSSGLEGAIGIGRGLTRDSDRWVITSRIEIEF